MVKLVNLARIVTSILLIFVLLYVYSTLPVKVALTYTDLGLIEYYVDKNQFFYLSLILFLATNLVTALFVRMFTTLPIKPQRFFFTTEKFKEFFVAWIVALGPVMNLFFICVVVFVGINNNRDLELIHSYSYLAYLGQFLVLGWVLLLVPILLKRSHN